MVLMFNDCLLNSNRPSHIYDAAGLLCKFCISLYTFHTRKGLLISAQII
jgi:hypothetical protein